MASSNQFSLDSVEIYHEEAPGNSKVPALSSWRHEKPTPAKLSSGNGTAVVHGSTAYFSCGNIIYSFSVSDCMWARLPPCPYQNFAMAIIDNKLTTIGGHDIIVTNHLLSLTGTVSFPEGNTTRVFGDWNKVFPPMPTLRTAAAAVTTATHLVVAGGHESILNPVQSTDVVEVLDIKNQQWYTANSLPQEVQHPIMTLCKGIIYLTDQFTVFSCTMEDLLKSTTIENSVWTTRTADIPTDDYTFLVTVREHMLIIGGSCKGVFKPTAVIHCYDSVTNSWSVIGRLPTPLWSVLAAVLPDDTVIVAGGYGKDGKYANSIYVSVNM